MSWTGWQAVRHIAFIMIFACLAAFGATTATNAKTVRPLTAVAPRHSCASLVATDFQGTVGGAVTLASATVTTTKAGQFCRVDGTVAPSIGFQVYLPLTGWTQRFLQTGCGGLCGSISVAIEQAGTCTPALNGEFVVAATDMGSANKPGEPLGSFAVDPQKRIDFAYRANHVTAQLAKALIRAFYGQPPRFSYFTGCSDGGREAMMEAQRYPDDFDGISAGAPVMNFQVQNSFYHAWLATANLDAGGKPILLAAKLAPLHAAVIAHCDGLDGLPDGLLSDPRLCRVDTDWVACAPSATDTSTCLTTVEAAVVRRIYDGPRAPDGSSFLVGGPQPGSELQWDFIPADMSGRSMSAMLGSAMRRYTIFPQSPAPDALVASFGFDRATFAKVIELHSLNDATNPDLRPFARHGGRLILWHGWSDTSVSPMTSIAYYKAAQQQMGAGNTDKMLRLFMLPGTGHCGGGDGFAQIDTLTPLMDWVENGRAPQMIVAGRIPDRSKGPRGGLPGSEMGGKQTPLAVMPQVASAPRPIYPFPAIPRPGKPGGAAEALGLVAGTPAIAEPALISWYGSGLFTPGFQRDYEVRDGRLAALPPGK